jgi:hypothetical protein
MKCTPFPFSARSRMVADLRDLQRQLKKRGATTAEEDRRLRMALVYLALENAFLNPIVEALELLEEAA